MENAEISHQKDGPASGLFRVKVYNEHRMAQRNGTARRPRAPACWSPRGRAEAAATSRGAASAKARSQCAALNHYPVPEWAHQQVYLHPYPKELMLRDHV